MVTSGSEASWNTIAAAVAGGIDAEKPEDAKPAKIGPAQGSRSGTLGFRQQYMAYSTPATSELAPRLHLSQCPPAEITHQACSQAAWLSAMGMCLIRQLLVMRLQAPPPPQTVEEMSKMWEPIRYCRQEIPARSFRPLLHFPNRSADVQLIPHEPLVWDIKCK